MNVFLRNFLSTVAVVFAIGSVANAEVIFDNTPSPLPANIPSLGYQAEQTSEFGNEISFAGTCTFADKCRDYHERLGESGRLAWCR